MGGQDDYSVAQSFILQGVWGVDLEQGHVLGMKGQPFTRTNSWGYTQIKFRRPEDWRVERAVLAHRVIWESIHGPLSEGQQINHMNGVKTDNRLVNLESVSQSANMQHSYATGLHHHGDARTHITEDQVLLIYQRCQDGERDQPLAAEFGVSRSAINNLRHGHTWSHITHHPK